MERLERMIRPDVVVFTSIGDAHQEHFGSLEQKCAEKMRLADRAHTIVYHSYYEPLASMIAERFADRRLIDAARFPAPVGRVAGGAAAKPQRPDRGGILRGPWVIRHPRSGAVRRWPCVWK